MLLLQPGLLHTTLPPCPGPTLSLFSLPFTIICPMSLEPLRQPVGTNFHICSVKQSWWPGGLSDLVPKDSHNTWVSGTGAWVLRSRAVREQAKRRLSTTGTCSNDHHWKWAVSFGIRWELGPQTNTWIGWWVLAGLQTIKHKPDADRIKKSAEC